MWQREHVTSKQQVGVFHDFHQRNQIQENDMKHEGKAQVFYCFRVFRYPDKIKEEGSWIDLGGVVWRQRYATDFLCFSLEYLSCWLKFETLC